MHNKYDTEVDHGEDKPIIIVSPVKGKSGISTDGRDENTKTLIFQTLYNIELFYLFTHLIWFFFQGTS